MALKVEPTKDWPEPEIPEDFQTALADAPDISESWTSITPMARWEWVRWINATKNLQTRERRVEVGISKLDLVSDGPAASISQHAPTQTFRRTAYS